MVQPGMPIIVTIAPPKDGTIAKPAPEKPAPEKPTGFTMHFHMGGNLDASFEMNVAQGKTEQKESPAKKRKMQQDNRQPANPAIPPSGYTTPLR